MASNDNIQQPVDVRRAAATIGRGKTTVSEASIDLALNCRDYYGDNDLAAAKAGIGDRICLLGNLDQIRFLKTATPEEVDAATRGIGRETVDEELWK